MCFCIDRSKENRRGHTEIAKSVLQMKGSSFLPVRLETNKTAGLDHLWLKPTSVEKARVCSTVNGSHLPMYFEIFFKKCIPDTPCAASFTDSSSTDLKSCVPQVEVQYVQHPFPCRLTPVICLIQPCSPMATKHRKIKLEDKISRDLHIVRPIRSLLSSQNSWNNLCLSSSATNYNLACIRIFQIQTRSQPPDLVIKKIFLNREVANLASCTHEEK